MRISIFASFIAALACATPSPVQTDFDGDASFASLRTFGIIDDGLQASGEVDPRQGPLLDQHTEDAIADVLSRRGYVRRTSGSVDFLVSYHNEFHREQEIDRSAVSVGIGTGYHGSGVAIGTGWGTSPYRTRTVTKGTMVIDVLDPETRDLIWRGWVEGNVDGMTDGRNEVFNAVSQILARFPPNPNDAPLHPVEQ